MNRLARESSPYLLQHAENPVDWYPWGKEAFQRARTEGKPILLSVGYSSCHWCHVMAHESFEDRAIAALMNEGFVNIKVDREERPDVDSVYMTFTQAMTGQGGWPMTVFLTPDLEPFYAGTYFPPDDRYGRPGFPRLLESVRRAWSENRDDVVRSAHDLTQKVRDATGRQTEGGLGEISAATSGAAFTAIQQAFDPEWGGFGRAPKFPAASTLEYLLMHGARTGDEAATSMVLHTCRRMTEGGMYDHLGGGFARYSVDARWLVPHFEKMLYDNALLAKLYVHAYQVSGEERLATTVRETLDYLEREMRDPAGGFYSAQDADSEGIEGKFFVWTPEEIAAVLGPEDGAAFCAVHAVTEHGNFEDPHHPEFGRRNVLSRPEPLEAVAARLGRSVEDLEAALPAWRERLFAKRGERVPPGLDDKVLTSWNGLVLSAFAEAGRVLDEARYVESARRTAAFLRSTMLREGRLLHAYRAGEAKVDALLEDYVYLGLGLVDLYRATGDLEPLRWAAELYEAAAARFGDDDGTYFESPEDGEALILRQKPFFDSPTPSGNASMALLGFWLGRYFGRPEWEDASRAIVTSVAGQLPRAATGFGAMLQAVELQLAPPREIAVIGDEAARRPFLREVARRYLPATVLAPAASGAGLPLLEGRSPGAGATAYVCENMVCDLPATSVSAFVEQLDH
ncbi:MAG: thioredoxin domain-containing protein [Dehalococcoidia bacterium]